MYAWMPILFTKVYKENILHHFKACISQIAVFLLWITYTVMGNLITIDFLSILCSFLNMQHIFKYQMNMAIN